MTGKIKFMDKRILTALLLVCLGFNSQISQQTNGNDSGSLTMSSEGTKIDESSCTNVKYSNDEIIQRRLQFGNYMDDIFDFEDDYDSDSFTTRRRSRRDPRRDHRKNDLYKFSFMKCNEIDKDGNQTGNIVIKKDDFKIEAGTNLECDHCLGLTEDITLRSTDDLEDIMHAILDNEDFASDFEHQIDLTSYLKELKKQVRDCEGTLGQNFEYANGEEYVTYFLNPYPNNLSGEKDRLTCLSKRIKKLKDRDEIIRFYEERMEDTLHSLAVTGTPSDRKMALKIMNNLVPSSGRSTNLPVEVTSSVQSKKLYIHNYNNIKEAYEEFNDRRKSLFNKKCKDSYQNRQHYCLNDLQYELALNQLNMQYNREMDYVSYLKSNDINGYYQQFYNSDIADSTATPYISRLEQEFHRHLEQIHYIYGIGNEPYYDINDYNPNVNQNPSETHQNYAARENISMPGVDVSTGLNFANTAPRTDFNLVYQSLNGSVQPPQRRN